MLDYLAERKKAIMGFFAPGVGLFATDFYSNGGNLPTGHEWLGMGVACVLTSYGVYKVSNGPADPDA